MSKQETEAEGARSYARLVATLSNGDCEREASAALQEIVSRIRLESKRTNRGVKGELTLKVSLSYKNGAVTVGYAVTTKEPKPQRAETLMFVTPGGNLTEDVPTQEKLPFALVDGGKPEVKEAPAGAPEVRSV